jgi:glyoxylase-like metal-dependent hydrolase (beta-lactamase superfamily II)
MDMEIIKLTLGSFKTNTYILVKDGKAVVIDPAGNTQKIMRTLEENHSELSHILLTHGHFDHTESAQELKSATGAKIYIHKGDSPMLNDFEKSFAAFMTKLFNPCEPDILLNDGDVVETPLGEFAVTHAPGHSPGSVLYTIGDVIFSGDAVFKGSVGRIDGWGGNHDAQMETIEKIKSFEKDYRILPGHEGETTLENEKRNNPFFN